MSTGRSTSSSTTLSSATFVFWVMLDLQKPKQLPFNRCASVFARPTGLPRIVWPHRTQLTVMTVFNGGDLRILVKFILRSDNFSIVNSYVMMTIDYWLQKSWNFQISCPSPQNVQVQLFDKLLFVVRDLIAYKHISSENRLPKSPSHYRVNSISPKPIVNGYILKYVCVSV